MGAQGRAFPGGNQNLFLMHVGDIAGRKDSRHTGAGLAVSPSSLCARAKPLLSIIVRRLTRIADTRR